MMKQVKASISALLYLWNALKISSYSMVGVSADLIFTNFLQTITLHRWFFFVKMENIDNDIITEGAVMDQGVIDQNQSCHLWALFYI